jgi:ketosteroid isomerase-like protein
MTRWLLAIALVGCGAPGKKMETTETPAPAPGPPVAPAVIGVTAGIQPEAWLVGDWVSDDGKAHQHWMAVAGALYGVRFSGGDFDCTIIDDAGDGGALVRWTYSKGQAAGPVSLGDDLKRTGDTTMTDAGVAWHRGLGESAPALEAADRAFYVATRDRGPDGWADAFAADGVNWGGGRIVTGRDAIKTDIAQLLGKAQLTWQPVGSRIGPGGDVGFTVGTFVVMKDGKAAGKGSYQTVWKKQRDGSWKVAADGGRPEN